MNFAFRPVIIESLKGYTFRRFLQDLNAGIIVGIIALPLSMAIGIASGVAPQNGLFTAVIAGFLASALGGCRVQISGPTAAFISIVYGIGATYGITNLLICTMMAGLMLIALGFSKLGGMIKFIPYPLIIGFTNGIAIYIFTTQIKDFLGLQVTSLPPGFFEKMNVLLQNIHSLSLSALLTSLFSLALMILWPRKWSQKVPATIVALLVCTLAVYFFKIPVETIGSRFGGIPQGLPELHFPQLSDWTTFRLLLIPAFTITILAAIESLLSAVVADGMTDEKHDSNQELIGQGVANLITPLFGGIPATGAIVRTAANIRNGGTTPVAGMVHALSVLVILLVLAPLAKFIPLPVLSAILVLVAYQMGDWGQFRLLGKYPRGDAALLILTFVLTVAADLTVAVAIGMVFASILFIKRVSENTLITRVDETNETEGDHHSITGKEIPPGVVVYRIFGALVFGSIDKLENILQRGGQHPRVLILRMRKVLVMDTSALNAMERIYEKLHHQGCQMIFSGLHSQPYMMMENAQFLDKIGGNNICPDISAALRRAKELTTLPGHPPKS